MPSQEPSKPLSSTTILSVIQPIAGTLNDLESHLLDTSQGRATTGERAGVDIIKAIVYGGLLECITSLSVITSAAGGDATTCEFPTFDPPTLCSLEPSMLLTLLIC